MMNEKFVAMKLLIENVSGQINFVDYYDEYNIWYSEGDDTLLSSQTTCNFSRTCKIWLRDQGIHMDSGWVANDDSKAVATIYNMGDNKYFEAETDEEAVFMACVYYIKGKND